jgi:uncharacterized protein
MGCTPVKSCNWYLWLKNELHTRGIECILRDFPDPYQCRESIWIPFLQNDIGLDDDTVLIGHSSGAACAMRLLERQQDDPLRSVILVATAYTDLGDEHERRSEYFSRDWNWEAMKKGAKNIVCYHGVDDPLIPVAEARHIAEKLRGENFVYHELNGVSHFFEPWNSLLDLFDENRI